MSFKLEEVCVSVARGGGGGLISAKREVDLPNDKARRKKEIK